MRIPAMLFLLCLTACSDWPDAGGPPMARSAQDWPELLPLDQLLATGRVSEANEDDAETLRRRAAALRGRAAILRGNASDMETLRARLNR